MNVSSVYFVGRQTELEDFETLLESSNSQTSVVYLKGEGGIGKTKLLERFKVVCSSHQVRSTQIIDFYDTDNQTVAGLMNRIVADVSTFISRPSAKRHEAISLFAQYEQAYVQAQELSQQNVDQEDARSQEQRLTEVFISDFNEVADTVASSGKRLVLFFDTLDAIEHFGNIYHWFLYEFIPKIQKTIVVFAGRKPLPGDLAQQPVVHDLDNFSIDEVEGYFANRRIGSSRWESPNVIQHIHSLTDGNPLLVTLAADWFSDHPERTADDLLGVQGAGVDAAAKTMFCQRLIRDILTFALPDEFEAVWYMSHIYHRFDADILSWITGRSKAEAASVIASLVQFPYIKYRPKSESYQLHDIMRKLVRVYVLDQVEDVNRKLRRGLSSQMIQYYEGKIAEYKGQQRPHDVLIMQAEQLYHYLYVDLKTGFSIFNKLARTADEQRNIPFTDLLLGNSKPYYEDFDQRQKALYNVYQAWLIKGQGNPALAEGMLKKSLQTLTECNDPLADEVASSLGHAYKDLGRFSEARSMYEEATRLNQVSSKDPQERQASEAQILNNTANLLRLQGLVDEAQRFAIKGLMLRLRPNKPEPLANSYYVLALIAREYGDNNGALRYLDKAENEYSKLTSDRSRRTGLGKVKLTRGYIYNHFREHEKAIEFARESYRILAEVISPPSWELADALDILGRLLRDRAEDEFRRDRSADEKSALARRDEALSEAEETIALGYQMARASKNQFKEAESILSFVRLFNVRGDYTESLKWYAEGIKICQAQDYYLLLSYYEAFAGSAYFDLGEHDKAFERFGWRALFASRCRAMELGMTMDSIAGYLGRIDDPKTRGEYANQLLQFWERQPEWPLNQRFPQLRQLCDDIRRLGEQ